MENELHVNKTNKTFNYTKMHVSGLLASQLYVQCQSKNTSIFISCNVTNMKKIYLNLTRVVNCIYFHFLNFFKKSLKLKFALLYFDSG